MPRGIRYDRRGDMPPTCAGTPGSAGSRGGKYSVSAGDRVRTQGEEALVNQRELLRDRDVARFIYGE
jgi:hypothetical protein